MFTSLAVFTYPEPHDGLTSVPVSRKTLRAGKYEMYHDFEWLKVCAHVDVYPTYV